jgi:hypothetical protein
MLNNVFYRAFYEILLKNIVEPDRPQMTIKYGASASHPGYLRLEIDTQILQYLLLFPATMGARTHLVVTLHLRCCFSLSFSLPSRFDVRE